MVKIFDCTIRDGGYANNWNFSDDVVLDTFLTAQKSNVDYFEAGYRNPGAQLKYRSLKDEDLLFLDKHKDGRTKIAAMINILEYQSNCISDAKNSSIDCVRVACHVPEIKEGIQAVEELYSKGYEVFLNVMNIPQITEEYYELLQNWQNKKILTSICFADSYGMLYPNDVKKYIEKFKKIGFGNVSIHTHNNLQLAFANSISAIAAGAYSVDGTVFGMGRGGGNLPIELLLGYLEGYSPEHYFELIEKYYVEMNKQYNWGYSVPTLISALKGLHPNSADKANKTYLQLWQE